MPEIRIRNREAGETFVGNGKIPEGYDLIGPASAPASPPALEFSIRDRETGQTAVGNGKVPEGWDVIGPASAPAPPVHPWVQLNEMARRGLTPSGEPIGPQIAELGKTAASAALPLVGTLAGSPAGPLGMATGAAVGEGANQALGITPPSWENIAIQFGVTGGPAALTRPANRAIEGAMVRAPGASPIMHELTEEQLKALATRFQPPTPASQLYDLLRPSSSNLKIPMTNLERTAKDLLTNEQVVEAGLKLPTVARTAKSVESKFTVAGSNEMPFERRRAHAAR